MTKYALVSGNTVLYSDGTKETVKKQQSQKPRKKQIKIGSKVMVNFNPELVAVVTKKNPEFVKTHEQQICNDPDGLHRDWFEFEFPDGKISRCHKKLLRVID